MTLRTAGLIAGVIGVILLLVAAVAQWVKPAAEANPTANVEATVVVVPPEVIALSPDGEFTFTGSADMAAHTARNQDVAAWTASRTAVTVTGLADWDTLTVTTDEPATTPSTSPSPSPSGSPSASASKSPAKSPSPSTSPSPTASGSPSPTPSVAPTPLGSQDIWRDTNTNAATFTVTAASVPAGLSLVVESLGDGTVDSVALYLPRTVDDAWISQVMWWGIGLAVLGLIALIALFIDVRPAQSKGEEWLASRAAVGSGKKEPKPGSRRDRRAAGAAIPMVEIPVEPTTTGSIPVVPTTGSIPVITADPTPFEPPTTDDEEGRS